MGRVDIARADLGALVKVAGQFRFAKGRLPYFQDGDWTVVMGKLLDLQEEFGGQSERRFRRWVSDLKSRLDFWASGLRGRSRMELDWYFTWQDPHIPLVTGRVAFIDGRGAHVWLAKHGDHRACQRRLDFLGYSRFFFSGSLVEKVVNIK